MRRLVGGGVAWWPCAQSAVLVVVLATSWTHSTVHARALAPDPNARGGSADEGQDAFASFVETASTTATSLAPSSPLVSMARDVGDKGTELLEMIQEGIKKADGRADDQLTEAVLALEAMNKAENLKPDRDIWTFGDGRKGQMGLPDPAITKVPRKVHYLDYTVVMRVGCGQEHMVAVSDTNNTYAWGQGNQGQLSDIVVGLWPKPHWSIGMREHNVTNVFAGGWNSLALTDKQELFSWGWAYFGQLGRRGENKKPDKVGAPLVGKKIVHASMGLAHGIAAIDSGEVFTFGANMYGQLGNGNRKPMKKPVPVKTLEGQVVVQVAAGCEHSYVLTDEGHVWSWGNGHMGQLGHGDWLASDSARKVENIGLMGKAVSIAAGCHHGIAVLESNLVLSWGWNRWGQLGVGDTLNRPTPRLVALFRGQVPIRMVAAGRRHTLLLTEDTQVFCWGHNEYGQCGRQRPSYLKAPLPIFFFQNLGARFIDAAADYSAVITDVLWADGRVPELKTDEQNEEDNGATRAHHTASKHAMHALIQADKFAEEAAIDNNPNIPAFEKPELKYKADQRVAAAHGVELSSLSSADPFVVEAKEPTYKHIDTNAHVQVGQEGGGGEGDGGGDEQPMNELDTSREDKDQAQQDDKKEEAPGVSDPEKTSNSLPTLDELKTLGPITDELDGEVVTPPSAPTTLRPTKPSPSPLPPMHLDWFLVTVHSDPSCTTKPQLQYSTANGSHPCLPTSQTASLLLLPSPDSPEISLLPFPSSPDCGEGDDNEDGEGDALRMELQCGQECVPGSPIVAPYVSVRCGYAGDTRRNATGRALDSFWKRSAGMERKQRGAEVPFRNCDPNSDDDHCHSTDLDFLWDNVRERLNEPTPSRTNQLSRPHQTLVNITGYHHKRSKLRTVLPEDALQPAASDASGGGHMLFNLWDGYQTEVGVAGVERNKALELGGTDLQPPADNGLFPVGSRDVSPIQYPPPPDQLDPDDYYPRPNPLGNGLKGDVQANLQEDEGAALPDSGDDFDSFFS